MFDIWMMIHLMFGSLIDSFHVWFMIDDLFHVWFIVQIVWCLIHWLIRLMFWFTNDDSFDAWFMIDDSFDVWFMIGSFDEWFVSWLIHKWWFVSCLIHCSNRLMSDSFHDWYMNDCLVRFDVWLIHVHLMQSYSSTNQIKIISSTALPEWEGTNSYQ